MNRSPGYIRDRECCRGTTAVKFAGAVLLISLIVLIFPPVQAIEPYWNYSAPDVTIGSIALSPSGNLVAAGAEKVLFFTKSGTLLDQVPYGTDVIMTPDGNYTVSIFHSMVYFFKNPLPAGSGEQLKATKVWESEFGEQVSLPGISRDGTMLAGLTLGKSLFIINTKNGIAKGSNDGTDSVIAITSDGKRIVGISPSEVHFYNANGNLTRTAGLTTFSPPHTLLLSGNYAIINDGQAVRYVNAYNGTTRWKQQLSGYITVLSMTPDGTKILAGTENGNIASLDTKGNLSWTYASNPENKQASGISCLAASDKGATVAAGTADGKILLMNAKGELSGSYTIKEYIRHVAVSADGSTIAAASESTLYVFAPGSSSRPQAVATTSLAGTTTTAAPAVTTVPAKVSSSTPSREITTPATVTQVPTTYSVIRTATQSPSSPVLGACSLMLVFMVLVRKGRG
jgi:WD40 repeat protein